MTNRNFDEWLSKFRPSISSYDYYIDFAKVVRNVDEIKVELNILNSLIGSKNIEEEFEKIVTKYPETLQCVPLLLAVRGNEIYAQDEEGAFQYNFKKMNYSVEQYKVFMRKTGLFDMIANHLVNNLVDYALGMLGPIKYLRKRSKFNVVEYGQDDVEFAKRLSKDIREKNRVSGSNNSMIDLTTIVGMHYFIQVVLYYFKSLNSKELVEIIECISEKEDIVYDDFKVLFNAALKLLFQDKKIVKTTGNPYSSYKLTDIGFKTMKLMITDCTRAGLCDKIRIELMHNEFYKSPHS